MKSEKHNLHENNLHTLNTEYPLYAFNKVTISPPKTKQNQIKHIFVLCVFNLLSDLKKNITITENKLR